MTAQSQPSETNPEEVSQQAEVQSEVSSAPQKPTDDQQRESWTKIQSERDRYAAELDEIQRQRDELSSALDARMSQEDRERFNQDQRLKSIEEENRQLREEKEEMVSEQIRSRLLENEFPKLKGLESVKAIKGNEEEQRQSLQFIEKELETFSKNQQETSDSEPEAESSSPAIDNVAKGKGDAMSPDEFGKLSLKDKAKYLARRTEGKALIDLEMK